MDTDAQRKKKKSEEIYFRGRRSPCAISVLEVGQMYLKSREDTSGILSVYIPISFNFYCSVPKEGHGRVTTW